MEIELTEELWETLKNLDDLFGGNAVGFNYAGVYKPFKDRDIFITAIQVPFKKYFVVGCPDSTHGIKFHPELKTAGKLIIKDNQIWTAYKDKKALLWADNVRIL